MGACAPAPAWRGLAKVGLVLPFHGPDPTAAMAIHVAVRDALVELNARGGVEGRRVELVSLDDQADPRLRDVRLAELAADSLVAAVLSTAAPADGPVPVIVVSSPEEARAAALRALGAR